MIAVEGNFKLYEESVTSTFASEIDGFQCRPLIQPETQHDARLVCLSRGASRNFVTLDGKLM